MKKPSGNILACKLIPVKGATLGAGEMIQQFRALAFLPEDPSSHDSTQLSATPAPKDLAHSYKHACRKNSNACETKINTFFK